MHSLTHSLGGLLVVRRFSQSLVTLLVTWQGRAQQRHHLASLSDGQLEDMGMTRADARREIRKHFWRA